MPRVCLVGDPDISLQYELLSRETARNALAAYDIAEPFANTVCVETVSLGAAVALLNDLDWYLTRFVNTAIVQDESISDEEWLSRSMATAIRDNVVDPAASRSFLKVYGLVSPDSHTGDSERSDSPQPASASDDEERSPDVDAEDSTGSGEQQAPESADQQEHDGVSSPAPPRLVEPMLVTPSNGEIPTYDLREVDDTLVVRVCKAEFEA